MKKIIFAICILMVTAVIAFFSVANVIHDDSVISESETNRSFVVGEFVPDPK